MPTNPNDNSNDNRGGGRREQAIRALEAEQALDDELTDAAYDSEEQTNFDCFYDNLKSAFRG